MRQEGGVLRCASSSDRLDSSFVRNYFRLDEDLTVVLASIMKDDVEREAIQKFYGLKLVRQERWECLASFVLATNSNIPRIRAMVEKVSSVFGEPLEFEGLPYHSFPSPEAIRRAKASKLRSCGLGYRARFLRQVAEAVDDGSIDFDSVYSMGYEDARRALTSKIYGEKVLLGVGPKVADCALLFSGGKDEAFPIDVWVARAIARFYPALMGRSLRKKLGSSAQKKLTAPEYSKLSKSMRDYFGANAGYAQQYLYMLSRNR
ncbi:MAG: 8-oxoguanine DNA glycosylase [Thaumarchaeota archaeon]|nr:8-oxoguanine DNA glycosylase [Nitrososphaerota archaeon]